MTISNENGSLRVVLSDAETVKYNIDDIFFETNPKKTDRTLTELLKTAVKQSGFKTDATRFLIEIFPAFDGGCEVFFTPEKAEVCPVRRLVPKVVPLRQIIFEFENTNDMLAAIELLFLEPKTRYTQSCLYRYKNIYRLMLSSSILPAVSNLIAGDFADRSLSSAIERAATIEHGTIICDKNAVAIIGSALCRYPF